MQTKHWYTEVIFWLITACCVPFVVMGLIAGVAWSILVLVSDGLKIGFEIIHGE